MATAAKFGIELTLSSARFMAGINQAERQWNSFSRSVIRQSKTMPKVIKDAVPASLAFGKQVAKMAKVTGAALGVSIAGLATWGVKLQASYEQTEIAFTTLLGSAEKARDFMGGLVDFAAKTPFQLPGIQQSSRQLLAYGFTAEKVLPTLYSIGDAVSALGGGQAEMDRAVLALGQMQAKGKLAGEEMRQLTELGIPAWEMLAGTIGVSIPKAMDLVSKRAITATDGINAILLGMNKRFKGSMDKQSRTLIGRWSTLKDNISIIVRGIGKEITNRLNLGKVLDKMTSSVSKFAAVVEKEGFINALKKAFPPWLELVIITIAGAITGALVPAITAALIPALGKLAITLGATLLPLLPWIAVGAIVAVTIFALNKAMQILGVTWGQVWSGITGVVATVSAFIIKAIWGIVNIISYVVPPLKSVANALKSYGDSLSNTAAKSFENMKGTKKIAESTANIAKTGEDAAKSQEDLGGAIEDTAKKSSSNLQAFDEVHTVQEDMADSGVSLPDFSLPELPGLDIAENLGVSMDGLGEKINNVANSTVESMGKIETSMGPVASLADTIATGWDNLTITASNIGDKVSQSWENIKTDTATAWSQISTSTSGWIGGIKNNIATGWNNIRNNTNTTWGLISIGLSTSWRNMQSNASTAWANLGSTIGGAWDDISNYAGSVWETIKTSLGTTWETIAANAGPIWDSVAETVGGTWDIISDIAGSSWDWIKGVLSGAWKGIVGLAYTVWEGLVTFFSGLWERISTAAITGWETIKTSLSNAWEGIKALAQTSWDFIAGIVTGSWDWIKTTASGIWEGISTTLTNSWATIKGLAQTAWDGIGNVISTSWDWTKTTASNIWNSITGVITGIWDDIVTKATTTWDKVAGAVSGTWNKIVESIKSLSLQAIQAVIDWTVRTINNVKKMKDDVINYVVAMINGVIQWFRDLPGKALEVAKSWTSGVVQSVKDMWMTIVGGSIVPDMVIGVLDWFDKMEGDGTSIADKMRDNVTSIVDTLSVDIQSTFSNAFEGIISGSQSLSDGLKSILSGMGASIKNVLIQQLSSAASNSLSTMSSWVVGVVSKAGTATAAMIQQAYASLVAFFAWSGPFAPALASGVIGGAVAGLGILANNALSSFKANVPGLATGGIVTGPTYAQLGEGNRQEMVLPLERDNVIADSVGQAVFEAMMTAQQINSASNSAGHNTNQEVVLKIDGATFARLVMPHLFKEGQRQGIEIVTKPVGV